MLNCTQTARIRRIDIFILHFYLWSGSKSEFDAILRRPIKKCSSHSHLAQPESNIIEIFTLGSRPCSIIRSPQNFNFPLSTPCFVSNHLFIDALQLFIMQAHLYLDIYTNIYIYIQIYANICMCVCIYIQQSEYGIDW